MLGVLVEAVLPLQSQLHSLYTAQLGVALLLCQVGISSGLALAGPALLHCTGDGGTVG